MVLMVWTFKSGRSTSAEVAFASDERGFFFAWFGHLRQRLLRICWEVPGVCRPETNGAKTAARVSIIPEHRFLILINMDLSILIPNENQQEILISWKNKSTAYWF